MEGQRDSLGLGRSITLGAPLPIPVGFVGLECFSVFKLTSSVLASHMAARERRDLLIFVDIDTVSSQKSTLWQKRVIIFLGGSQKQTVPSYLLL